MKNPHAQALGKLAKGVPKNYSPEERQRRAQRAKLLPRGPRTLKPQQQEKTE